MEIGAKHVLNHLYSSFCAPIACALLHRIELSDQLHKLFIADWPTSSTDLDQCPLDCSYGLVILFVYHLGDTGVSEEVRSTTVSSGPFESHIDAK